MPLPVSEACNAKNITATTTIFTGPCQTVGVLVSSTTAGTLKFSDGATTLVNTFSPAAATWYPIPARYGTSLVVTVGGTLDCCVFWNT